MAQKRKEYPIIEKILITDIAAEGKSIARIDDMVVFVPFVVPGDVVDLKLLRKKRNYVEAVAVHFHEYSEIRVTPFCVHFGQCGGCKWQNLPYSEQLIQKDRQVLDTFTRIAKVKLPVISPIIGSDKITEYRNKLEFSFSNKRWLTNEEFAIMQNEAKEEYKKPGLGFHISGAFDKVLHIDRCWLQDDICNRIRNAVFEYAVLKGIPFINLRSQEGVLRNMIIRVVTTGQIMAILQAKVERASDMEQFMDIMNFIADSFKEITSLLYVVNNKGNDTFNDLEVKVYRGQNYILENIGNLSFKIGPKSFFQTNTLQMYKLYSVVKEMAELTGEETVYDLYTGIGTIAIFLASTSKKVVGVEFVPEAIEDAKENALINNIHNTLFFAGDMKDILNETFFAEYGNPDVIVTDPPRSGMHKDVIKTILYAKPKRIIYVSCNPATQARDLAFLDPYYKLLAVQPVDMFPHTNHVEVVSKLVLRT
ncbi:MAG TPA: 23S rRNA (uracil(1939)-C(5))-methyltransferase RlmD [Bacteroidaceae bacterium]|nr:23S rRNA (uracil(1939)-C(5))-methyltransferase RlmD [Bacteroidaceae bacterium]